MQDHLVTITGRPAIEVRTQRALGQPAERIRTTVQSVKDLPVNVDFYSASVYYTLGIPIDMFTPIFAISRVAGWTAHVYEQYSDNRLIRPESEYIGPMNVPYVPISERG